MKSGSRGHNLISVELTAEGVEAVAEAVVRKLVERGILPTDNRPAKSGDLWGLAPSPADSGAIVLPETGFLRVSDVLRFIPVCRSTWWLWCKQGKAPTPIKLGGRVVVWRAEDIRELMARIGSEAQ